VDTRIITRVLLAAALPVFFIGLGANSIWDANEAFYVETPRQMVETGDFINPSFGGEPRFNKPVLSYWLVAAAYSVLGESVAVERLVIALAAMGVLGGTVLIGLALGGRSTGILAALLLATAPRFVFFSRRILIDLLITLFMTLTVAAFALAERYPARRRALLILMYVAIGLGVLSKGPVALVLPAGVFVIWLLTERRLGDARDLMVLPGAAIVIAIVIPWYAAIYAQHGWEYIRLFFIDENLGRFQEPFTTARGFAFFIPILLADILLPWAPLIVVPLIYAWRRLSPQEDPAGPTRRLLWCWVVVIVVAFSFSASKQDLYILPVFPAAAALVADSLLATGWGAASRSMRLTLMLIALLCVIFAGVLMEWFADGYYAIAAAPALAGLLAVTGLLAAGSIWRWQMVAGVLTLACGFTFFNYLFVARVLPDFERLKPVPPLAAIINAQAGPDDVLASYNMDLPSMVYYTRRPVTRVGDLGQALRLFEDPRPVWMLMSSTEWESVQALVPGACVVGRRPNFAAKASDIMKRQPPMDVVLVTERSPCR
jgi:4-amino-4-deoxy-L-arabinose transferase-like glycosyltransferase